MDAGITGGEGGDLIAGQVCNPKMDLYGRPL